ncbi:LOW QUALITY PROTEIN: hypothetical protein Cgig2_019371 [Carnegiea gigantea]|uniref:Reverse transcriptase domain-containing protein n=1 Tax=Carnegiea gigantea TaxID=171969 RepID=A0A9Q1QFM3_9CARY|nr:LOW QUALITY PROTEIN: hypothetical protein Cgig2_019371 [Carnegiea gigantea]
MIQYARLLIEVPIEGPFPDYVDFFNEKGQLIRQQVQFEWKPTKCTHCHMLGHTNDICKKKKEIRKEWRPIVQGVSATQNIPSTLTQRETPVRQNPLPSSSAQDQEIHKEEKNIQKVASNLFASWRWIHNFHLNSKGRIWLAWRPSTYQIKLIRMSEQLIHCELSINKHFYLSIIYGLNHEQQRESLWNDLMDISSSIDRAWCLMGDFNTLRFKEDRIGGNEVQDSDIGELATLLDACEIHDLKSSGAYYSWTNKTIWSRIDHVFLNDIWYDSFDYTHSSYLPNSLSDHTPILLQFPSSPRPPSVFQYCDMWSKHKEFNNIILSHKDVATRSPMLSLCGLLKRLRHPLRSLHRDNFVDLRNQQVRARNTLESLQELHHQHPNNNSMAHQEKEARERYISILSSSIDLIKQQGKIEWIKYGDDSTRLFYAKAKQRKLSSYIYTLKDQEGKMVEGFEEVGQAMSKFYKDMLGEQLTVRSHIDMDVIAQGKILSSEQQVSICRPFTNKDIKEALWSIPNHKSPGPDGYSSGFFKSTWDQTGHLVCDAVQDFFQYTSLPKEISATKLVVIPKVQHPQYAHEFRPISYCIVIYKCITKLLGQRIKEVLSEIIHPSQGAFVEGRELLYNVLICQDLARGYQRKQISPRCMLKIGIQKAFDSVHWDFITDMLKALCFPQIFITWIKSCVTSVSFDIHINGRTTGTFKGGCGLKQGDPVSPLLFVKAIDYLSRLLHKHSLAKDFKFHLQYRTMRLTNLMFADDLILFCKADPPTLHHIMSALRAFHETVGLKANLSKSQVVVRGCKPRLQEQCLRITGFAESSFPMNYLGVPITASRLTKLECNTLLEKIRARVRTWTTKHLSFAGRAMLINSAIFGMINYWASIFIIPHSVIESLTKICKNFLWGGQSRFLNYPQSCLGIGMSR